MAVIGGGTALLGRSKGPHNHDWFPPHYLSQSSPTYVYAFIPDSCTGTQSRSVLSPLPRPIILIRIHTKPHSLKPYSRKTR